MAREYGKRTAAQQAQDAKNYRAFTSEYGNLNHELEEAKRRLLNSIIWARRNDMTWTDIAEIAGITRQSAQRKWAHLMPEGV